MNYGYENKNKAIEQISILDENGTLYCSIDEIISLPDFRETSEMAPLLKSKKNQEAEINEINTQLLNRIKDGDQVVTSSLINFGQTIGSAMRFVELLVDRGAQVRTHFEHFDSESKKGQALLSAISLLDEYDHSVEMDKRYRQRIGIKKSMEESNDTCTEGKTKDPELIEKFEKFLPMLHKKEITKVELAKTLGISRPTLDKMLKIYVNV